MVLELGRSFVWCDEMGRKEGGVRWTDGRADGFGRAAVCGGFWAFSVGFCWGSGGGGETGLGGKPRTAGWPPSRDSARMTSVPHPCAGHVAVRARRVGGWHSLWAGGFGRLRAGRPAGRVSLRLQLQFRRRFALFPPAAVWRLLCLEGRRSGDDRLPCEDSLCVRCFTFVC